MHLPEARWAQPSKGYAFATFKKPAQKGDQRALFYYGAYVQRCRDGRAKAPHRPLPTWA
jgi:hypothetical protein